MTEAENKYFKDRDLLCKVLEKHLIYEQDDKIKNLFFKTNKAKLFFNNIIKDMIEKLNIAITSVKYELKNDLFAKPYSPFLEIIKSGFKQKSLDLNEKNIKEVFDRANVYYFHRPMLQSYLLEKDIERQENILIYTKEDLIYEKQEFFNSLLELIKYFSPSNERSVYVIENTHYLKSSTISFLKYLINDNYQGDIVFIYLFNEEYKSFEKSKREKWDKFLKKLLDYDYFLELNPTKEENKLTTDLKQKHEETSQAKIKAGLKMSQRALKLLAIEEAKEYAKKSYDLLIMSDIEIEVEQYFNLVKTLGDVSFLLGENNSALTYYNKLLNLANQIDTKRKLAIAYQKIAVINLAKHSVDISKKYANLSLELAEELKDENLISRSQTILLETLKSFILEHGHNIDRYIDFFNNLERKCQKKSQHYVLMRLYQFLAATNEIEISKRLSYCEQGIEIAEEYSNKYILALLYHRKGMIYSALSKDRTIEFYKRSESLRLEIGDVYPIVKIYNGIGYAHFDRDEYKQAIKYYKKTFLYLKDIENNREIGSVCFNLAVTYMFGQDYKKAIFFFEKALDLLEILNLDTISYHNINDIYLLLTFCSIKTDNIIKAKNYFNKADSEEKLFRKERNVYYNLALASLSKAKENYTLAEKKFEVIINQKVKLSYKHLFVKAYYEYGLFLKEVGKVEKSEKILKEGMELCKKIDYSYHKDLMLKELNNQRANFTKLNFEQINFDIDIIIDYVKQEKIMNKLYKKIDETKFLNDLQKIFLKPGLKIEQMINKVCKLINITFNVSFIAFYIKRDKEFKKIYLSNQNLAKEAKKIVGILLKNKEETLVSRIDNNQELKAIVPQFNSAINLPLFNNNNQIIGNILIANQNGNFYLGEKNLKVLSVASKQISSALINKKLELEVKNKNQQLEKKNQELERMASIDGLTKVANRKFFDETLKEEWNRAQEENLSLALLMMDVDDFKSYNDNYGHQKGDQCLIKLANMFKKLTLETSDLVARYGGDEFAVILAESSLSRAKKVGEKIKKETKKLNLKHEYSKISNHISLSIGVALAKPQSKDREEFLIKSADKALYKAKRRGSNRVEVAREIIKK